MNKLKRTALLIELERYLHNNFAIVKQEVVFSKIMDTTRKFRADYLIEDTKTIIEVNGGSWINGRHNRGGKGYENDLTKLNLAQMNGYKVIQFTYEMLEREEFKILKS